MRATVILDARIVHRQQAGPKVFLQTPTGRTDAQVRAVSIDTIVGTFMFPFVLAFVNIHADALLMRIRISRETCTIAVPLGLCTVVLDDGDASTIVFSEFESRRAGTRVGSLEILAVVTAIVRRLVLALVLVLACVTVHVHRVTRRTLASITRTCHDARVRARRIGARIDPPTGEIVVLQDPSGRTRATVGRVLVDAQMRTLVITLETLVDISTLTVIVVSSKSSRTRGILAPKAILDKPRISRTGAFVTTGDIDALVRTLVFIL